MHSLGLVRVAAAVPMLRLADVSSNLNCHLRLLRRAEAMDVDVVVFPELSLTGYTCHDLFHQQALQHSAKSALEQLAHESAALFQGIAIVGVPLVVDDQLFNCAAVIHRGRVLGVVPKTYLPNYKEFYDARYFAPAKNGHSASIEIGGQDVVFGTDSLFEAKNLPSLVLGVEICEDLWTPVPPSSLQSLHGATLIVNLSASPETIGKAPYRRNLVAQQSARCFAGYVYAGSGIGESTTDLVFGGHCMIAENGSILAESDRFQREPTLLATEIDLDRIRFERVLTGTFAAGRAQLASDPWFRRIGFTLPDRPRPLKLLRGVDAHPFRPRSNDQLRERCEEIFHIQVTGLSRRLEHVKSSHVAIGVSGGLDSTLALLVVAKTMDVLGRPRSDIRGLTMPGFGTTSRTLKNAHKLMQELGTSMREIDIRPLCFEEMKQLQHSPFSINLDGLTLEGFEQRLRELPADAKKNDLVFENVQARARTNLLMNTGFVIGTGDLSELALGWCTYNADHISMYNPNVSVPKTLVKFLVDWAARNQFDGNVRQTLLDVVDTKISPELLPTSGDDQIVQATESIVGPYELHDFFLFHFLRYGTPPSKILFLAELADFDGKYPHDEIKHWLVLFLKRFFANQFKRSCLPDGPKVGSVSLSPRGDWRMPSDAVVTGWLSELGERQP